MRANYQNSCVEQPKYTKVIVESNLNTQKYLWRATLVLIYFWRAKYPRRAKYQKTVESITGVKRKKEKAWLICRRRRRLSHHTLTPCTII
jgi:hypothetical protein